MKKIYVAYLFVFIGGVLRAQSPGGVGTANLALWLKPDGLAAGPLATWIYANNGANQFTSPAGNQPTVVANTLNFWPAISFDGSTTYMTGSNGANAPLTSNQLPYAIFAVWSSTVATGAGAPQMRIWSQRQSVSNSGSSYDGASIWIYPSGATESAPFNVSAPAYGDQLEEGASFTTGVSSPTNTTTTPWTWGASGTPAPSILTYAPNTASNPAYISSLNLLSGANTNDLELMDQSNYGATPAVTSTDPFASATTDRLLSTQENVLGARTATAGDQSFNGNLSELIVLNTNVTATQREQIFSYLALKYGLPLNGNYLSSAGTTIWDATALSAGYNNNLFGLGMDNASGLTVTQSNNSVTGSGSGAGNSGMLNVELSSPSGLTDQGFLMVGSNNAGTGEVTTNMPTVAAGSSRLANQWLVQNTGTVGTVNVSVDFTGVTTTGTQGTSSDFRLVTDNDGDGDFTTGTQSFYTPTSWTNSNTIANFSAVNLAANSNVVFTVITNASGGTPLPVNWVNFTAVPNGGNVNLNWTVGANDQAKVYQVQRSADGTNFSNIGQVTNDPIEQSYGYVDAGVGTGTYYYRVLEVDLGGASIYSKIVSVNMSGAAFEIKLLNNPTITGNTDPELQVTTNVSGNVLTEIWTLSGSRVGSFQQAIGAGTTTMRVPLTSLAAGTYAVKVILNNNTQTLQVVKL